MTYERAEKTIKLLIFTIALTSCIFVAIAATGGASLTGAAILTVLNGILWLAAQAIWWFWG